MKNCNFIKILFTTTVFLFFLSSCGSSQEREQKYLLKAEKFFSAKNYKKSQIEARNVLQINPKNTEARFLLGKIQLQKGEVRSAFKSFNNVVQESPNHADAHLEIAKIYFAANQLDKAKESLNLAINLKPNNKNADILLAGIYSKTNQKNKAKEITEKIIKNHPAEVGAVTILTQIYDKKDPQKALELINNSLNIKPDNLTLKELKIRVLTTLNQKKDIEPILQSIIEQHPNKIHYFSQLSQYYTLHNRSTDAEKTLFQAIENNPESIEAKTMLIETLHSQNKLKKAEEILLEYIDKDPEEYKLKQLLIGFYVNTNEKQKAENLLKSLTNKNNEPNTAITASNTLANLYLTDGRRSESEVLIKKVLELEPANAEALILNARIKLVDKENKSAIADLRAALKDNSNSIPALKLLALAQQRENLPALALDNYRRIINIAPSDIDAWQQAGAISYQQNNIKQAKTFLNHIINIQPKNQPAVALMTTILGDEKNWSTAHALLEPLIQNPKDHMIGAILKARLFTRQNEWKKAATLYQEIISVDPNNYEAVAGYAESLLRENPNEAISFLKRYIETHDHTHTAKHLLASFYIKNNQLDDATVLYNAIINQSPQIELAHQKLAALYELKGNLDKAKKIYSNAIHENTNFHTTRLYFAGFYDRQKNYSAAMEQYEVLLQQKPQSDIVKNNVAVLLINHFPSEDNYHRALDLASSIGDQKNPYYIDTIGWTHYKLGNINQAISYLQAAVNLEKDNKEFRYHLGMAYHKNGEIEKAKQELQLATSNTKADYEGANDAKKALQLLSF